MKQNQIFLVLAIGAVLFFVANKKNSTEPVAELPAPEGTATGDPAATELQSRNVPAPTETVQQEYLY